MDKVSTKLLSAILPIGYFEIPIAEMICRQYPWRKNLPFLGVEISDGPVN
jgi:hypothetical protein